MDDLVLAHQDHFADYDDFVAAEPPPRALLLQIPWQGPSATPQWRLEVPEIVFKRPNKHAHSYVTRTTVLGTYHTRALAERKYAALLDNGHVRLVHIPTGKTVEDLDYEAELRRRTHYPAGWVGNPCFFCSRGDCDGTCDPVPF